MRAALALLKYVAKALGNAVGFGVAGDLVVEVAPELAQDVWEWWHKDRNEAERRAEIEAIARAGIDEAREQASDAVREALADRPIEVRQAVETYLVQVPASIRRSLRRPADPTGSSVSPELAPRNADDLLRLLLPSQSHFKPGDRPSGMDFELLELLGVGGFGEVWKARHLHLCSRAPVALKFCTDAVAARVLRNEAAVLDRVIREIGEGRRHPGIVQLRNTYLSVETPCLEYEYVEGGDLAGLIHEWHRSRGGLTAQRAAKVMLRLAQTVSFAHQLNPPIVHRDLKPANVLVQRIADGKVQLKVADFGIGGVAVGRAIRESRRAATSAAFLTSALRGSCTPLYASPQQMRGEPPDPRDDVFSLGVIWYQLLTGNLAAGRPGGTKWPSRLKLGPKLVDLLQSCFEEEPEDRPQDAAALATHLAEILKEPPPPEPPKKRPATSARSAAKAPAVPPAAIRRSEPKPFEVITNSIGMKMLLIPAGEFMMGSPDGQGYDSERPQHRVRITKPFYLGCCQVTVGQYRQFATETKLANTEWQRAFPGQTDDHPVVNVRWEDANAFLKWLSGKERKPYRLPTEAEWEYACRAGTQTQWSFGDNVASLGEYAWYIKNAGSTTHPVGQKKPNAWSLFDMHGNVWEWCEDWFESGYYAQSPTDDPKGSSSAAFRVLRGGSWSLTAAGTRSAFRGGYLPVSRDRDLGFRAARTP